MTELKEMVKKYIFYQEQKLKNYSILIGGRNFYDQPIDEELRKYGEVRNIMIGRGEEHETGSLLDYACYRKDYKLIACDLSKQKVLDSDPKSIQQIEFVFKLDNAANNEAQILTVLEKKKETILEFSKATVKVY